MNYQLNTRNTSFIKMHQTLMNEQIFDAKFLYALLDPDLLGVNPYDPNLTVKIKRKIITECKCNIWYYFREIARIPIQGGDSIPFEIDKTSCALIYCSDNNNGDINSIWTTKPRQLYSSITMILLMNYYRIFHNKSITYISKNKDIQKMNVNKSKMASNYLPLYIQKLEDKEWTNDFKGSIYGKTKDQIKSIIESIKSDYIFIDDAEFVNHISYIIEVFKNRPDGLNRVYFNSTICDNNAVEDQMNKMIKWKNKFYDNGIFLNVDLPIVHILFHFEDLETAKNNYYTNMCKSLANNQNIIRREVLLERKNKL